MIPPVEPAAALSDSVPPGTDPATRGRVAAPAPRSPMSGARARPHDELADWTDAALAEPDGREPLPLSAPLWPGYTVRAGSGGTVFLRRTPGPQPEAWYVHGLEGSSTNWTALSGLLSDVAAGVAPDLPGNGRSDPPPLERYDVRYQVRLVADLIRRQATDRVHLVGNSYGGYLVTLIAAEYPELVRSLTLISPAVPDLRLRGERGADPRLALLLAPGTTGPAERQLASMSPSARATAMAEICYGNPALVSAADRERLAAEIAWRQDLPWVHRTVVGQLRGLMRGYLRTGRDSWWAAAGRVRVPSLVVWGTRDRLVDVRLARRTAQALPGSRLLVLAGVGHTAQMEDPVTTARAIRRLWQDAG